MRNRILSLSLTLVFAACATHAQAPAPLIESLRAEIDSGAAARDTARLSRVAQRLERALVATPNDPWLQHYRGFAIYRLMSVQMEVGPQPAHMGMLQEADRLFAASSAKMPLAESFALRSSTMGMQMGLDQSLGMTLGGESISLMARAVAMAPNNPRVLVLAAISALYTPESFGGGVDKARPLIARAKSALASDAPPPLAPRWGRSDVEFFDKEINGASAKP
jgi:hypothetical protein